MANNKGVSIKVSEDVFKKLKALKHPGQSFNGLFTELLDELDSAKSMMKDFTELHQSITHEKPTE